MPIPGTWDDPKKHPPHISFYPVISNVNWQVNDNSITINWTTDVASTTQVRYGFLPYQSPLPLFTPYNATPVTSHSVTIVGFTSATVIYFNVQSFYFDSLSISAIFVATITGPHSGDIILEDSSGFLTDENGTPFQLENS